ncbi:MAG TPA: aminoglycoside phosphotransferase family protein [Terriglobia bacterium]|nr:aminoglycoside phosphotransferase family protein [Terriglobia bacterium]
MKLKLPRQLQTNCSKTPERVSWLRRLPESLEILKGRWSLTLGEPFEGDNGSCAWVAPVARADGTSAVLKLGMPHMESEHESQGLGFWDGDPTVRLLEADRELSAILLERCEPGTSLTTLPEPEQDLIIAGLLRRLWRLPPKPHPFRPLSAMLDAWSAETLIDIERWPDAGLVREGLALFRDLARPTKEQVLLATDLHAGNVLRSKREPWLVIDPKPFVGDPSYDVTQHLFNCSRLTSNPEEIVNRMADLLGLDRERVRRWTFARAAAEPREHWHGDRFSIARALAPST